MQRKWKRQKKLAVVALLIKLLIIGLLSFSLIKSCDIFNHIYMDGYGPICTDIGYPSDWIFVVSDLHLFEGRYRENEKGKKRLHLFTGI